MKTHTEEVDGQQKGSDSAPERGASPRLVAAYRRSYPGTQPAYLHPPYVSSIARAPKLPLIEIPATLSEVTGPDLSAEFSDPKAADLTKQHSGEPIGERIVVSGRVIDENGRPLCNTPIEIWQANACGRYQHERDQHDAPLDPNFSGNGFTLTDSNGGYKFITIKPGSYPWGNHYNAWRPAHIHFSLFGPAFVTRLVTQMYFPGDPLLPYDPIFNCTADEKACHRLISALDWENVRPEWCLAYKWDIVLRGREATPFEDER
jgi:protocatechuate 3,4-dioxygenase beta subunit